MTIEESLARVQLESPHHGPIVAALVLRLEARLESAERVVEAAAIWRTSHVCCPKDCPDLIRAQRGLGDALDAHSAAKEPKP